MKKYSTFSPIKVIILLILFAANSLYANNIQITNARIVSQNVTEKSRMVRFDISWENSWRTTAKPGNWDAAWVFGKFRVLGAGVWNHMAFNFGSGHVPPTGCTVNSSNDDGAGNSHGVFIFSSNERPYGDITFSNVQLQWNYDVGTAINDDDSVEVALFGIEMVYVSQNSFYLGSGGTEADAFYTRNALNTSERNPFQVTNSAAIDVGNVTGNLHYNPSTGDLGDIPDTYPNGFDAFYCMKYEISQEQYEDFLFTLTDNQETARYHSVFTNANRWGFSKSGSQKPTTAWEYVAMNHLSWNDLVAYLDWAGLRPMTDLEFEKACRGEFFPTPNDFPWGTNQIQNSTRYTYTNFNNNDETLSSGYSTDPLIGNAHYSVNSPFGQAGPMRVGIFSGHTNHTGRVTAGATYYGIMEMSGNVSEYVVNCRDATGRTFDGQHGDGNITLGGESDVPNWPTLNVFGGKITKGGDFGSAIHELYVSWGGVNTNGTFRDPAQGGRGVRTAP